jgi:DNA repair protein RadC
MLIRNWQPGPIEAIAIVELLSQWLKRRRLVDRDKEHFFAIGFDSQLCVKYIEVVSIGTLSNSLVHPREVFRYAVMCAVSSILVAHNHPCGNVTPSDIDCQATKLLVKAGMHLGIPLLDHLIFALTGESFSFLDSKPESMLPK